MNLQQKNTACVNGTIEITLEQIQCDIAMNLQHQNCRKFTFCVSRPLRDIIIYLELEIVIKVI